MRLATGSTGNWFQSWATASEDGDGHANLLWASGSWTVVGIDVTTGTYTDQDFRAQPIYVDRRVTLDRIGLYVTTPAGSAGAVARAGIYAHDATTGLAGALLVNGGSDQAVTSTNTLVTWTISTTLDPGIYWLALLCHGAPATAATLQSYTRASFTVPVPNASASTAFTTAVSQIRRASVGTSLPDPFGTPASYGSTGTRLGLRVA